VWHITSSRSGASRNYLAFIVNRLMQSLQVLLVGGAAIRGLLSLKNLDVSMCFVGRLVLSAVSSSVESVLEGATLRATANCVEGHHPEVR